MKTAANLLGAVLAVLFALSTFSDWQLAAFATVMGLAAYRVFFSAEDGGNAFMVGVILSLELFGGHRLGTATLLGVFLFGLLALFRDILRFTSPFGRFIVALIIFMATYPLFFLPLRSYFDYLPQLAVAAACSIAAAVAAQRASRTSEYELL